MPQHFDVIIIGSGAGGGTLAYRLAPSGKKILILERGDFLPRERENWDPIEVFRNGRYQANETWFDKDGQPFRPYTHYWVGGNTKMYGAALLRLRVSDFGEVRHYGGVSPAWPIAYSDLEPYYTEAEKLYSVHGERGLDPTDPPASAPYPFPAVPFEPRMQELYEGLKKRGLHPFPVPLGVRLPSDHGAQVPYRLSNFDGFPDLTEVKADAHVVAVEPALKHKNVTLLTRAKALRLEADPRGRAIKTVLVERDGEALRFSADIVVLACGAINSAALLLRSDLANSSDQVGRNYMAHNNGTFIAISETPNPSQFQKAFGLTDFYHRADDSELPLGTVQLMGKMDLDWLYATAHDQVPNKTAEELSRHAVEFFLTAEDLPDPNNRVSIRKDGAIQLDYNENNMEAYRRLFAKMAQVMGECGCPHHLEHHEVYVGTKLSVSGISHQNGTLRMGRDSQSSVVDVNCKAYDLDNLYVADASFFPSSGAVNPSLTIMANALRVGDLLLERLR
jgi:choline dehydrogenase-like flavoprotein